MNDNSIKRVWQYFLERTKRVYVERCTKIESFEEYLSHRYRDNCYYYSGYALMGLTPDDCIVRGKITLKDEWAWRKGSYVHGWVEFVFEDEEYVFDSMLKEVASKQEYYDYFKPKVHYRRSQKEILGEFLNEKCAIKIEDFFYQFKYYVMNENVEDLSHTEIINIDRSNGWIPSVLKFGRIKISPFSGEIIRFIAYSEPSA